MIAATRRELHRPLPEAGARRRGAAAGGGADFGGRGRARRKAAGDSLSDRAVRRAARPRRRRRPGGRARRAGPRSLSGRSPARSAACARGRLCTRRADVADRGALPQRERALVIRRLARQLRVDAHDAEVAEQPRPDLVEPVAAQRRNRRHRPVDAGELARTRRARPRRRRSGRPCSRAAASAGARRTGRRRRLPRTPVVASQRPVSDTRRSRSVACTPASCSTQAGPTGR